MLRERKVLCQRTSYPSLSVRAVSNGRFEPGIVSFVGDSRLNLQRRLNSTQIGREEASSWPMST